MTRITMSGGSSRRGLRPLVRALALLLVAVPVTMLGPVTAGAATAAAATASATAPYCGIRWGSLPKTAGSSGYAGISLNTVRNVRAGEHACYDRLVIEVSGKTSRVTVRYVPQVTAPGSGATVALRGGARLEIVVQQPAYDQNGRPTYAPANRRELVNVTGYRTFRQVALAGSFEGSTTIGLGVRARLPLRVFLLDGPGSGSRVVIDVAHRW